MAGRRSRLAGARYDVDLGPKPGYWMGNDDTSYVDRARAAGGQVVWVPAMRVEHYVAPHRVTLSYLQEFYEGLGRSWIRDGGIPRGRSVGGVPIWIWQQLLWHRVAAIVTRPRSRVLALGHLRDAWRLTGAVREARVMVAERRARNAGPQ
jgi:GT2 family glycosyltransferase